MMKETLKTYLLKEKNQITENINKLKSGIFTGEKSQQMINLIIEEKESQLRLVNSIIELCLQRGRF